jgi:hypothetical protein
VKVLVTIHGIGFQQAPSNADAQDGYADSLHAGLASQLPAGVLGDDPNRARGPVYVESSWPPESEATEAGLSRLGTWTGGAVAIENAPLVRGDASLAHVALIYSRLEELSGDTVAMLGVGLLGATSLSRYASIGNLIGLAFHDIRAKRAPAGPSTPSLQPRETAPQHRGFLSRLFHHPAPANPLAGPIDTFHQVQDDVAAYVVRNEHRERVRDFIRDAVYRILARPDVDGVIINGHSNGCVMAFDLLAAISPPQASKVRAFVTSGNALRKYVDFMDWGTDARNLGLLPANSWTNFYDGDDPVADPMLPPVQWRRGDPPDGPGLFVHYDPVSGAQAYVGVTDVKVDNVAAGVGGGLPEHNYWDNREGFVKPLAAILETALVDG